MCKHELYLGLRPKQRVRKSTRIAVQNILLGLIYTEVCIRIYVQCVLTPQLPCLVVDAMHVDNDMIDSMLPKYVSSEPNVLL